MIITKQPQIGGEGTVLDGLIRSDFAHVVLYCSSRAQRLVSVQYVLLGPLVINKLLLYYSTFLVCRPALFQF